MSIYLTFLKQIIHTKTGRDILFRRFDKQIYKKIMEDPRPLSIESKKKKYLFVTALIDSVRRNLDRGQISLRFLDRTIDTLVKFNFTDIELNENILDEFHKRNGIFPPTFIVLSPTQKCNLNCKGCYASSRENCPSLSFETVEKICDEVYNEWGSRFMVISGGEPLMYNDNGKTLLDIWKKYPEMFFLFYTNGTLITDKFAEEISKLGNVTPAISIEGWEKETDERRGNGIYQKIVNAAENLKKHGVAFGVSVTATSKNFDILMDEGFYDFLFNKLGASYMWQFQLMPIGKAKDMKELMVTPEQRVKLYRMWEKMLEKKYAIADFWNSGALVEGCVAYGRQGGYLYIDWNGNIMPCVFVPYYVDNVLELHKQGKRVADALKSDFFVNGRKWQGEYGLNNLHEPNNWLMPCSIRDHYKNFKKNILTENTKPEDDVAKFALESEEYEKSLEEFDEELEKLTDPIWDKEYLEKDNKSQD